MPWWSWILIWVALVSLSLLFFVVMGVRLFRQFMATVKELGEAGDKLTSLPVPAAASADAIVASPGSAVVGVAPGTAVVGVAPGTAPFTSPHQMRHDYHASNEARREVRRQRRVRRKAERGQPQSLRDIEFR